MVECGVPSDHAAALRCRSDPLIDHTTGEHKNLRFCFSNPLNFHLRQARMLNYKDAGGGGGGGVTPPRRRGAPGGDAIILKRRYLQSQSVYIYSAERT